MSDYYFAYGSNMNPARVQKRQMAFHKAEGGVLHDYHLAFNKTIKRNPAAAAANVMAQAGRFTEGVLYQLTHPDQILQMDPFEGYPELYERFLLPVMKGEEQVSAWVYIANPKHTMDGLQPNRWYLNHLLAGQEFLTEDYYVMLESVVCLPNTDVE